MQDQNLLLSLPRELRLEIYNHLFDSTTFFFSPSIVGPVFPVKTQQEHISLLRTCHTIFEECQSLWTRKCTFRFANTERFLDILTPLVKTKILGSIRNVVVEKTNPFCLMNEDGRTFSHWAFHEILPLLPGLQLDQLILGDSWHDAALQWDLGWVEFGSEWGADVATYKGIQNALKDSNGWRELRTFSPTGSLFTWSSVDNGLNGDRYMRWLQPMQWNQILSVRDGKDDLPKVHIYKNAEDDTERGFESALARDLMQDGWSSFEQTEPTPGTKANDMQGRVKNDSESSKPSLIIAIRGDNVSYSQDGTGLAPRITKLMRGLTWAETKAAKIYWDPRQDLSAACA